MQDLEESILAKAAKEHDEKLNTMAASLKRMIQAVANAPVQVSLSDDAKADIIRGVEKRLAVLEKALKA